MKRTAFIGLTLLVGIAVGVIGTQVLNAQQQSVKRTELLRKQLAGMEGHEGIVFIGEIAPGAVTGKHYHPGHEFLYVLEGSGTWEVNGEPPLSMKAGDSFYQPPDQAHNVKNGSETAPLKNVVFLIAPKGQSLGVPVK
jgi:quercetin dioxygenase-like cupin family protein